VRFGKAHPAEKDMNGGGVISRREVFVPVFFVSEGDSRGAEGSGSAEGSRGARKVAGERGR
jgi:hypothetical protein